MASRYKEEKVPKLRITFQQLQKKCSELLLDGFESKPRENDLEDVVHSSSCNENDGITNSCDDVGQSGAESPKKRANAGGLFQIKPTSLHPGSSQVTKGSRLDATRRRGSEQPERWLRDRRLFREDESGRFSEPSGLRLSRSTHQKPGLFETSRPANGNPGRDHNRVRRHTDDGRISDSALWLEERHNHGGMYSDGRRDFPSVHRSPSSSTNEKELDVLLADWHMYTDGRIQKGLAKYTGQQFKLAQILHTW